MAKARRFSPTPLVRAAVRSGVRSGLSALEVSNDVTARFANVNRTSLNRIIREEEARQRRVDDIMNRDKRLSVDLRSLVGCRGKTSQVRARITISWFDPNTQMQRTYGGTEILRGSGRLSDILNEALGRIATDATGKGYTPPTITSAQKSGSQFYRIEYVECT